MQIETLEPLLSRRELVWGAGMLAVLGMSHAQAGGHTGPARKILTPEEQQTLEESNEALVTNFIRDYAQRDVELLARVHGQVEEFFIDRRATHVGAVYVFVGIGPYR